MARRTSSAFKRFVVLAVVLYVAYTAYAGYTGPRGVTISAANSAATGTLVSESGTVDYGDYQHLLNSFVSHTGGVDYIRLRQTGMEDLASVLNAFATVNPDALPGENHRKAYFINLTNAFTMYAVALHEPVSSARKLSSWFYNYLDDNEILLPNGSYTLNALHDSLASFDDPAVYFAVSDGTLQSGRLNWQAYTAEDVELLLSQNLAEYLRDQRFAQWDKDRQELNLSHGMKEKLGPMLETGQFSAWLQRRLGPLVPKEFDEVRSIAFLSKDLRLNSTTPCNPGSQDNIREENTEYVALHEYRRLQRLAVQANPKSEVPVAAREAATEQTSEALSDVVAEDASQDDVPQEIEEHADYDDAASAESPAGEREVPRR